MPLSVEHVADTCRIRLSGEMTIYNVEALKDELLAHLAERSETELDLAEVGEMDTAGLQLLVLAKQEARRHGWQLRLQDPSAPVRDLLELYNMSTYFDS